MTLKQTSFKKMLQQTIINMLKANEKIGSWNRNRKSQQWNIIYKEKQNRNFRTGKCNNQNITNSMDGLKRRMEKTEGESWTERHNRNYTIWTTVRKWLKNINSLKDLWDYNRRLNIHVIGVLEGVLEEIDWKLLKLTKEINLKISEAKWTPSKRNPRQYTA